MKEMSGIAEVINKILTNLDFDAQECQVAPYLWEIAFGSATINISYDLDTGFLFGDAYLCSLPEGEPVHLLTDMLVLNQDLRDLRLGLKDREIVLSWTAYDKYFSSEYGQQFIQKHLEEADRLDNYFVEKYGCKWPPKDR